MVSRDTTRVLEKGKITIDSGAAESVIPANTLRQIKISWSSGSRAGLYQVAASGRKMPNLGGKRVKFRTKNGKESNILFQVTHARKPLASVSKILQKGNMVAFAPDSPYIKNISSIQTIDLIEEHGTYHLDVENLAEGFARQA